MNKKRLGKVIIALSLAIFVYSLYLFFKRDSNVVNSVEKAKAVIKEEVSDVTPKREEKYKEETFKFYYYDINSSDMIKVERPLIKEEEQEENSNLYKEFLNTLIIPPKDCIAPVPKAISIRTVYYISHIKRLVIDFDDSLLSLFPGGSTCELEFVYFFVNNLCLNFKEVKSVLFIFSGNEEKVLSGHLDMERAFFPDYSYLHEKIDD